MNRWSYSTPADQFGAKPYSRPTPTAPPQRVSSLVEATRTPVPVIKHAVAIRGHGRAALDVEQHVVGGVADLAGEQAERVDLRVVGDAGSEQADIAALEVGPVALGFETEHPGAGLPAIADLTTGGAAGRIVATFGSDERASRRR